MLIHTANSFAATWAPSSNTVPESFLSSHCILCPVPYSSANKQDAINMYLCLLHPIHGMNIVGYHLKMMMPKVISVICCALLCVFFCQENFPTAVWLSSSRAGTSWLHKKWQMSQSVLKHRRLPISRSCKTGIVVPGFILWPAFDRY